MHRLLELSVSTGQILKDMSLYSSLGFTERQVNEIVQNHYGVLGDGDFHVGLHEAEFEAPTLTYVLPDVARFAPALRQLNIEFERADLSDEQFNQISFFDPHNQRINLIEARTFSPMMEDDAEAHVLGSFVHIELPHSQSREQFWNRLQDAISPVAQDGADDTVTHMVQLNPDRERLTAVYEGDLEALIVHSAMEGWQRFSVTADNHGLFRTPHEFDLLIKPLES